MRGMREFIRMFLDAMISRLDSADDLERTLRMLEAGIAYVRAHAPVNMGLVDPIGRPVPGVN